MNELDAILCTPEEAENYLVHHGSKADPEIEPHSLRIMLQRRDIVQAIFGYGHWAFKERYRELITKELERAGYKPCWGPKLSGMNEPWFRLEGLRTVPRRRTHA
jgi:hypothetical protein